MIRTACVLSLLALTGPLAAQDAPGPGWELVPRAELGWYGDRWGRGDASSVGISNGPGLGASLLRRPGGRVAYEGSASIALTEYSYSVAAGEDISGSGAGEILLARLAAGLQIRARANAPGYFTAGAGALLYHPREQPFAYGDESQWMPLGYAGAGIDLASGGHTVRLDGRLSVSRPTQSEIGPAGRRLDAKTAMDWLLSLGYVLRL